MRPQKEDTGIDLSRAGTGRHFQSGRLGDGLSGQLRRFKWSGGAVRRKAKNLSTEDLGTISKIIGDELKRLPTGAKHISYFARRRMQKAGWKAQQAGKISESDREDLKEIVDSLSGEHVPELHRLVRQHEEAKQPEVHTTPVELHNTPLARLRTEDFSSPNASESPTEEPIVESYEAPHALPELAPLPEHRKDPSAMDIG